MNIYEKLKRFYKISIIPAIIFFIFTQFYPLKILSKIKLPDYINLLFILISIAFALIFPILFRIIIFFHVNSKGAMSEGRFIIFEKVLILISQISIYIMIIAHYFLESQFVMIVLSVIAFYSLFYYYPTEKKINFDRRIFMLIK